MGVILFALSSEKAVGGIERENKLTFIVEKKATRKQIKEEIEKEYGHKVRKVTLLNTPQGRRKAFVSFEKPGIALELAAKLKVI